MKYRLAVLVSFLLLVIPARVFAKGDLVRITIKSAHLTTPIEITDPKTLANIHIWTGPGTGGTGPETGSTEDHWFIIDSSQGTVTERLKELQRYEVSFYV
jgi:hypothetical protein